MPHGVGLFERFCGVVLALVAGGAREACCGGCAAWSSRLWMPFSTDYSTQTVPRPPGREGYERCTAPGALSPFEFFAAMRFWLCGDGEPRDAPGELRRRRVATSPGDRAVGAWSPTRPYREIVNP